MFVFASAAARRHDPDWFHNLVANPQVTVEFGAERFAATARCSTVPSATRSMRIGRSAHERELRRVPGPRRHGSSRSSNSFADDAMRPASGRLVPLSYAVLARWAACGRATGASSRATASPARVQQATRYDQRARTWVFAARSGWMSTSPNTAGSSGGSDREGYLRLAQTLRDLPRAANRCSRSSATDRTITRFDRGTGAFLAFERDGTIRTFFRPNDGEQYFQRQARR